MRRHTCKYLGGKHSSGCFHCGKAAVGIQTDRKTGEEYWTCKSCIKGAGFVRKGNLHIDFRKSLKKDLVLCVENQNKAIVGVGHG